MNSHSDDARSISRTGRKGLVARILEALHASRRREASRVLHRYRHLIAEQPGIEPAGAVPDSQPAEKSSGDTKGNKTPVRAGHRTRRTAKDQIAHDQFA